MNTRIDPTKVTDFNRTKEELELFLLFCVSVAGKTAKQISIALENFLSNPNFYTSPCSKIAPYDISPFEKIKWLIEHGILDRAIKESKLGQHKKLSFAFSQLAQSNLDLKSVSIEDLEKIKGIGPKTSRFFILHSRKTNNIACLDTHQLKYMKSLGIEVPKAISSKKQYYKLEKIYLDILKQNNIKDVAEFDLMIWNQMSTKSGKK